MPRIVSSQELEQIAQAIACYPEGVGIDVLLRSLGDGWTRRTLLANRAPLEPPNRGLMEPVKGVVFRVPDGVIFGGFPGILQTSESLYLRRGDQRATQSYPRPPARRAFPGELAGGRRWVTRLARTTVIRVAVFTP